MCVRSSKTVVSNIIFCVLFVSFSYCGIFKPPLLSFFSFSCDVIKKIKKRREISALTYIMLETTKTVYTVMLFVWCLWHKKYIQKLRKYYKESIQTSLLSIQIDKYEIYILRALLTLKSIKQLSHS